MKEAFYFMFKDNMLKKKVAIYFAFVFLAALFSNYSNLYAPACKGCIAPPQYYILYAIGSLIMLIPCGYLISCIKAFVTQNENFVLPFVNIKNNLRLGFKLSVSIIILTLLGTLVLLLLSLLIGFMVSFISLKLIPIAVGLLGLLSIFIISFYALAFFYIFATTESWISFIRFKKATQLIKSNLKDYFLRYLLYTGITIAVGILSSIFTLFAGLSLIKIAVISVLTSLISCYTVYLNSHLIAKSIKE